METIKKIEEELQGKTINLKSLDKDRTVIIIIDMVNGFVYEGALSSPRVASIVDNIVSLNIKTKGYNKIFFMESHGEDSMEFGSFPVHCIKNSHEADLIPELKNEESRGTNSLFIEKNSTNGFITDAFQSWLRNNIDFIDNYIVVGCVTDICVLQFVLSLKSYFNDINANKRIIVPKNCVETYDLGSHNGDIMNLFSLYNMHINGVEIVDKIN